MKKRILAMALALILVVGILPMTASASSGGDKVAAIAAKYSDAGATAATFGFNDEWCGAFLYRCAEEAGEGAAMCGSEYTMQYNPRSMNWFIDNGAEVGFFYDALPWNTEAYVSHAKRMDKSDYTPQLGDIIYFDWDGYGNGGLYHVEIVTDISGRSITTVGGNTGAYNWWESSVNPRWSNIDSGYIVAFARPNYSNETGSDSREDPATPSAPTDGPTKTQYRYHRYEDNNGEYAVCAYWGNVTFNTTMHLVYSDWLDAPLPEVKQGYVNYLEHPNQGASCANAGCLSSDPFEIHRHVDPSGKVWYYEETRQVPAEVESTPTPTPTPTPSAKPSEPVTPSPKPSETATPSETVTPSPTSSAKPSQPSVTPSEKPSQPPATPSEKPTETDKKGALPLPATRSYAPDLFWDVKTDAWFYNNVADAYEMGLMNGTGANSFSPGNNMTLAEAVTLAARIHSLYHNGAESFTRYDGGSWYDPYVDYARANKIIDVNYDYSRPATREEFVHILARALPETELACINEHAVFDDHQSVVYISDVELLSKAGIINGIPEAGVICFKPNNTITRAEVAAVVARMARPASRIGK